MPSLQLTWVLIRRNWLTLWFVVADCWYVLPNIRDFLSFRLLTDAVLYSDAARAWLTGGDPWLVTEGGTAFGAPPPTLLLYVPFAFLPSLVTALVWLGIDLLAVAFVIRRLHLPWWWVLFPPLAQAIVRQSGAGCRGLPRGRRAGGECHRSAREDLRHRSACR
jgi:hypothetical protein